MASKQFHVMMLPWLAFGHMIPSLEFSKKLASKVRSCGKFEGAYVALLEELYQKPVFPVGLLPRNTAEEKNNYPDLPNWPGAFKWLDKQARKSVVFVGFGTEYKMPVQQVHELAHGIELSKLSFIWILRNPEGLDISELLPTGFLDRTSDRGIVCLGWAPQSEILAHPAIGGCVLHSGWGSIIESLSDRHFRYSCLW
ncbi:PREDICTED: UDP-glycosyltransferase 91A1-like [Populus euphratica]|uniref:anthocyanidin 3-O-glucosyltransferase n=1 Tax=Populus euphratica TaxID=75702 RepID=A0AAJ6V772_POPEU|nr:PREDICTED: UDP-glycosyltransferase 91A1-like [Populus euphratica]